MFYFRIMCDNNNKESPNNKLQVLLENALKSVDKINIDVNKWNKPQKCAVSTCTNTNYENSIDLYNFPLDPQLRDTWSNKCSLKSTNADLSSLKICSDHFTANDIERNFNGEHMLKFNAVPSKNLSDVNIPSYDLIKEHVDTTDELQSKIDRLKREKMQLMRKIKVYDKKIKIKRRNQVMLKNKIDKLKMHSSGIRSERNILSKVFSEAQISVLMGKKKVIWNDDDLAMAFSLRQMSSRQCYLYLKTFLNLPLPALSCVQKWASVK